MSKSAFKDIYDLFIKKRKRDTFIFFGVSLLLALISAPIPYIFGYLIDQVIPSGDKQLLMTIMAIMTCLFLLNIVIGFFNHRHALQLKKSISIELSDSILKGIFRLNYQQRLANHTGDLISRLTRDINELHFILPHGIARFIYAILVSIFMISVLIYLSWELSLVLMLLIPFIILVYRIFNQKLWEHAFRDAEAASKKLTLLQEVISADAEIKTYGASETFKTLALSGVKNHLNEQYLRFIVNTKVDSSIGLFPVVATSLIWYLASLQAIEGEITIGLIVTYTSTIAMIVPALLEVVTYIAEYPNQITMLRRIQTLTDAEAPQTHDKNTPKVSPDKKNISTLSVVDLSFKYPSSTAKPLYENASLQFQRGTSYLIKAPNGFGKSTLFTLLSGQLSPQQGSIQINEYPIQSIEKLHQYITVLPQDIHLVSDSIRNNVAFGDTSIHDHEILSMLTEVGLDDWIAAQKDGLDTLLSHSNKHLSGGQVQRLGLARAFLRKAPILLLDEPTNNLDNKAIQYLIKLIKDMSKQVICLVISHDDRIYPHLDEVIDLSTAFSEDTPSQ